MSGTSTRLPEAPCPYHCGHMHNTATGREGKEPKEGDFSLCIRCRGLLRYGPGMLLRRCTWGELEETRDAELIARVRSLKTSVMPLRKVAR